MGENREESAFLPAVSYGYVFTKYNELSICSFGIGLPWFTLGDTVYALLSIITISTGSLVYVLASYEGPSGEIRDSVDEGFARKLDHTLFINLPLTLLAPLVLLLRVCNGDLINNSLLFIQLIIFASTLWHAKLSIESDELDTPGLFE